MYHGFQNDPRPFYENTNCLILPSYHEGLSNVLLEAAATGRPIITSNIPGCREVVEDGKNGFLCRSKDYENLYECIIKFINLPYFEKVKMGELGRKKMEQEFDKEMVVKKTLKYVLGNGIIR